MPFIGKNPTSGFSSIIKDDFTPNGTDTTFTLSKQVANANDIAVFVGNVRQEPTTAYTVNGTTLDFGSGNAPANGLDMYVLHIAGTLESSVIPADGTISSAKIVSGAVTDAKIAAGAVTDAKISGMASSKLSGALPALDGNSLTNLDLPIDDHVRITFSGPNISNNSLTYLTPTLQGETNGGFTIQNTNEIKISVTGHYLVTFIASASTAGASGYTPISYVYKNTSSWNARAGIRGYAGSSTIDFPSNTTIVSMNSTSDYFKFAVYQNQGGTATGAYGTATIVRIGD